MVWNMRVWICVCLMNCWSSCNCLCNWLFISIVTIPNASNIEIINMIFKQFLLCISIISGRHINRRDSDRSARDSLIALGSMNHGHAVLDEAFFYDFLSLSIEFNKQNLDAYVQVNIDPNFPGFTKSQFNTLLEKWIYAMLATGYWSTVTSSLVIFVSKHPNGNRQVRELRIRKSSQNFDVSFCIPTNKVHWFDFFNLLSTRQVISC